MSGNVDGRIESAIDDLKDELKPVEPPEPCRWTDYYRSRGIDRNRMYIAGQVNATALGALVTAADTIVAVPFFSGKGGIIDQVIAEITAASGGGTTFRIGLYETLNESDTYPGKYVGEAGTTWNANSATVQPKGVRLQVKPNKLYHFAWWNQSNPTTRAVLAAGAHSVHGFPSTFLTVGGIGVTAALTYSATNPFPDLFPEGGTYLTTSIPAVGYRWEK